MEWYEFQGILALMIVLFAAAMAFSYHMYMRTIEHYSRLEIRTRGLEDCVELLIPPQAVDLAYSVA
jgi:hypothetical protein